MRFLRRVVMGVLLFGACQGLFAEASKYLWPIEGIIVFLGISPQNFILPQDFPFGVFPEKVTGKNILLYGISFYDPWLGVGSEDGLEIKFYFLKQQERYTFFSQESAYFFVDTAYLTVVSFEISPRYYWIWDLLDHEKYISLALVFSLGPYFAFHWTYLDLRSSLDLYQQAIQYNNNLVDWGLGLASKLKMGHAFSEIEMGISSLTWGWFWRFSFGVEVLE